MSRHNRQNPFVDWGEDPEGKARAIFCAGAIVFGIAAVIIALLLLVG